MPIITSMLSTVSEERKNSNKNGEKNDANHIVVNELPEITQEVLSISCSELRNINRKSSDITTKLVF